MKLNLDFIFFYLSSYIASFFPGRLKKRISSQKKKKMKIFIFLILLVYLNGCGLGCVRIATKEEEARMVSFTEHPLDIQDWIIKRTGQIDCQFQRYYSNGTSICIDLSKINRKRKLTEQEIDDKLFVCNEIVGGMTNEDFKAMAFLYKIQSDMSKRLKELNDESIARMNRIAHLLGDRS